MAIYFTQPDASITVHSGTAFTTNNRFFNFTCHPSQRFTVWKGSVPTNNFNDLYLQIAFDMGAVKYITVESIQINYSALYQNYNLNASLYDYVTLNNTYISPSIEFSLGLHDNNTLAPTSLSDNNINLFYWYSPFIHSSKNLNDALNIHIPCVVGSNNYISFIIRFSNALEHTNDVTWLYNQIIKDSNMAWFNSVRFRFYVTFQGEIIS